MGRITPTPSDVGSAVGAAVELQRRRAAEDRCGVLVDGAYRWLDGRPGLTDLMADPAFELFAAQAITLRRTPEGATSAELEAWLVESWARREAGDSA